MQGCRSKKWPAVALLLGALLATTVASAPADMPDPESLDQPAATTPLSNGAPRVDLACGFYYQMRLSGAPVSGSPVHLPACMSERRKYESDLAERWHLEGDAATDNPLSHGASYVQILVRQQLARALILTGSLTADHRGFSYGSYAPPEVVFYPRFVVDYQGQPFGRLGSRFGSVAAGFRVGTLESLRHQEGLTLYNLDCPGGWFYLQSGRIRYTYLRIADLFAGIGLGIDDLADHTISLMGIPIDRRWRADLHLGITDYMSSWEGEHIDVVNLAAGLYPDRKARLYGQLGYRMLESFYDARLGMASLVGLTRTGAMGGWRYGAAVELRYYGGMFNYKRSLERTVHYRDTAESEVGNHVGPQLYPLGFFERPFSQWAVFSEYHRRYLNAVTFQSTVSRHLTGAMSLKLGIDLNAIHAEGEDGFLYSFYEAGLMFEAGSGARAFIGVNNKAMNLDRHYPTFYQLEEPVFLLQLTRGVAAEDER